MSALRRGAVRGTALWGLETIGKHPGIIMGVFNGIRITKNDTCKRANVATAPIP